MHSTSPIRRYTDQVIHRLLKGEKYSDEELAHICLVSNHQKRKINKLERELNAFTILKDNINSKIIGKVVFINPYKPRIHLLLDDSESIIPIDLVSSKLINQCNYMYLENGEKMEFNLDSTIVKICLKDTLRFYFLLEYS